MLKVQPVAAVVVADLVSTRNNRMLAPSVRINVPDMLIQLMQVSPVHSLAVLGWIGYLKSAQAAHFSQGWTKSSGKPMNMFSGWSQLSAPLRTCLRAQTASL